MVSMMLVSCSVPVPVMVVSLGLVIEAASSLGIAFSSDIAFSSVRARLTSIGLFTVVEVSSTSSGILVVAVEASTKATSDAVSA